MYFPISPDVTRRKRDREVQSVSLAWPRLVQLSQYYFTSKYTKMMGIYTYLYFNLWNEDSQNGNFRKTIKLAYKALSVYQHLKKAIAIILHLAL